MKKLFIICLTVCLALTALAAAPVRDSADPDQAEPSAAPIIDLSGYEDGELMALLAQVQAEIVSRHIEKTASLRAGTYVFGKDIPVGKYLLKKAEEVSGSIELAAAGDPEGSYPSKIYEFLTSGEEFEAFITAEDGDILTIETPCDLTISVGVQFQ